MVIIRRRYHYVEYLFDCWRCGGGGGTDGDLEGGGGGAGAVYVNRSSNSISAKMMDSDCSTRSKSSCNWCRWLSRY